MDNINIQLTKQEVLWVKNLLEKEIRKLNIDIVDNCGENEAAKNILRLRIENLEDVIKKCGEGKQVCENNMEAAIVEEIEYAIRDGVLEEDHPYIEQLWKERRDEIVLEVSDKYNMNDTIADAFDKLMKEHIFKITQEQASEIIEYRVPKIKAYVINEDSPAKYTGIDNSDGDAWTEDFKNLAACKRWLNGGTK